METESLNQNERSKRTIIIVILVLFLGCLVYFISRDQPVNFRNKAADAENLDSSQASRVMLLGYSEMGASGNRLKVRVQVPHDFAFTPESVALGTSSNTKDTPQTFSMTQKDYECHDDMEDADHPMMGYETQLFEAPASTNLDDQFYVTFTSQNGKKYATTLSLAHTCTVLGKDAVQQVSPPIQNDIPKE